MIRLRFCVDDLARTRFEAPYVLCELAGSVQSVQRPGSALRRKVRESGALPRHARRLMELVPAEGEVPDFLVPEAEGLDDALSALVETPRSRMLGDLARTRRAGGPGPLAHELLQGETGAVDELVVALRRWHDHVLAPYWENWQEAIGAEVSSRAWQLATQGAERTLNSLHPQICWHSGVLEVGGTGHAQIDLGGRGLTLVPSLVWTRPAMAMSWDRPALTYPLRRPPRGVPDPGSTRATRLAALLGATRSRVLVCLLDRDRTTGGLAAAVGISPASASTHASVLRDAGLVASRREGKAMRHALTELGSRLVLGHQPREWDGRPLRHSGSGPAPAQGP